MFKRHKVKRRKDGSGKIIRSLCELWDVLQDVDVDIYKAALVHTGTVPRENFDVPFPEGGAEDSEFYAPFTLDDVVLLANSVSEQLNTVVDALTENDARTEGEQALLGDLDAHGMERMRGIVSNALVYDEVGGGDGDLEAALRGVTAVKPEYADEAAAYDAIIIGLMRYSTDLTERVRKTCTAPCLHYISAPLRRIPPAVAAVGAVTTFAVSLVRESPTFPILLFRLAEYAQSGADGDEDGVRAQRVSHLIRTVCAAPMDAFPLTLTNDDILRTVAKEGGEEVPWLAPVLEAFQRDVAEWDGAESVVGKLVAAHARGEFGVDAATPHRIVSLTMDIVRAGAAVYVERDLEAARRYLCNSTSELPYKAFGQDAQADGRCQMRSMNLGAGCARKIANHDPKTGIQHDLSASAISGSDMERCRAHAERDIAEVIMFYLAVLDMNRRALLEELAAMPADQRSRKADTRNIDFCACFFGPDSPRPPRAHVVNELLSRTELILRPTKDDEIHFAAAIAAARRFAEQFPRFEMDEHGDPFIDYLQRSLGSYIPIPEGGSIADINIMDAFVRISRNYDYCGEVIAKGYSFIHKLQIIVYTPDDKYKLLVESVNHATGRKETARFITGFKDRRDMIRIDPVFGRGSIVRLIYVNNVHYDACVTGADMRRWALGCSSMPSQISYARMRQWWTPYGEYARRKVATARAIAIDDERIARLAVQYATATEAMEVMPATSTRRVVDDDTAWDLVDGGSGGGSGSGSSGGGAADHKASDP